MADAAIPAEVQEFILRYIDSITQLEALLLLRASPNERWDLANTTKRLYAGERDVEAVLLRLCADRLLRCEGAVYIYDPEPSERRAVVDRLAEVYSRQLISVTNLIHDKQRRIREFADAFRFRRET